MPEERFLHLGIYLDRDNQKKNIFYTIRKRPKTNITYLSFAGENGKPFKYWNTGRLKVDMITYEPHWVALWQKYLCEDGSWTPGHKMAGVAHRRRELERVWNDRRYKDPFRRTGGTVKELGPRLNVAHTDAGAVRIRKKRKVARRESPGVFVDGSPPPAIDDDENNNDEQEEADEPRDELLQEVRAHYASPYDNMPEPDNDNDAPEPDDFKHMIIDLTSIPSMTSKAASRNSLGVVRKSPNSTTDLTGEIIIRDKTMVDLTNEDDEIDKDIVLPTIEVDAKDGEVAIDIRDVSHWRIPIKREHKQSTLQHNSAFENISYQPFTFKQESSSLTFSPYKRPILEPLTPPVSSPGSSNSSTLSKGPHKM